MAAFGDAESLRAIKYRICGIYAVVEGYCKPLPLGVSKAGSSSRGEDIFVDFRSAVTGDRWLTGDADLEGDSGIVVQNQTVRCT